LERDNTRSKGEGSQRGGRRRGTQRSAEEEGQVSPKRGDTGIQRRGERKLIEDN